VIRETRVFWNGKTGRNEVWLELVGPTTDTREWTVWERGHRVPLQQYPNTDDGYAAARADYEARVAIRMEA